MHTIGKNSDGTWWVGRMEMTESSGSIVSLIFDQLPFHDALPLCSYLNGGPRFHDTAYLGTLMEYAR